MSRTKKYINVSCKIPYSLCVKGLLVISNRGVCGYLKLGGQVVPSLRKKSDLYTANAYRQTTDKLMFKSVISTVR